MVVRQLHVPVRIKTEQSILIYMPCMQPELKIQQMSGFSLGGKRQLAVYYLGGLGVIQARSSNIENRTLVIQTGLHTHPAESYP